MIPAPFRHARRTAVLAAALVASSGCTSVFAGSDAKLSARTERAPVVAVGDPARARDVNPDSRRVEVVLEADESRIEIVSGKPTPVWAYNAMVPGPTIVANLGDEVLVHLKNRLPEPTTIHWHGVELPAVMDGSHISQVPVQPGKEFHYQFKTLTAATYWYHSHISGAEQVEQGLYGALIVRDPAEDRRLGLPEEERVLVVDDVLLDGDGQFPPFATDRASALAPVDRARQLADGREGNHLLVNGQELPTFGVTAGKPQRWRIVNVANGRFLRLSIPGQTLYRIGGDAGLIERPERIRPVGMIPDAADPKRRISEPSNETGLVLIPGERAEVVITPSGGEGDEITVEWHDLPRGRHEVASEPDGALAYGHNFNDGKADPKPLMKLRVSAGPFPYREYAPPSPLRPVSRIDVRDAPRIQIPFGHTEPEPDGSAMFFSAQRGETPVPFHEMTSADAPDVVVGRAYVLEVANLTKMDHPLHVHGFFFQPLEVEYVDPSNAANNRVIPFLGTENKDVIRLPAAPGAHEGAGGKAILRAAIRFDDTDRKGQVEAFGKTPRDDRSGGWMIHCHNQEHADQGMMTFLELRYDK